MKLRIAILLSVLCIASALAQNAGTFMLRYKYTPGYVSGLKLSFITNGEVFRQEENNPMQVDMKWVGLMTLKIVSVDKHGNANIVAAVKSATKTLMGQVTKQTAPKDKLTVIKMTVDPLGKVIGKPIISGMPPMPGIDTDTILQGVYLFGVPLPSQAVRVGDSWTAKTAVPSHATSGAKKPLVMAKLTCSLVKLDTFKGSLVYRIKVESEVPMTMEMPGFGANSKPIMTGKGIGNSSMEYLLSRDKLYLLSSVGDLQVNMKVEMMDMSAPNGKSEMKVNTNSTVNMVRSEAKAKPKK
jgi:hypothetical protein